MSLDYLQSRSIAKRSDIRQAGSDTPIAIRLKYKNGGTFTSATVTTATSLVLVTSDGGTDTYLFSAYTTVGALVDAINADGIFEAKVLDTVRSEATASQFVNGAISSTSEDGNTYYDVKVDTDAADYFAVRITYDRGFDKAEMKKKHRVSAYCVTYLIDLGTAAANAVKIYDVDSDGITETLVTSATSVDNTATTPWGSTSAPNPFITLVDGHDLVVKIDDSGNLADAAGNYLTVYGELE